MHVRELTHRNREGVPYRRAAEVEEQIMIALALAPDRMIERAQLRDHHSPVYLQEECLVYMLREFQRRHDEGSVAALGEALLRRCARHINGKLQALGAGTVDDAFADVVSRLFELILDVESDAGDFLQVRFWVVLEKIVVTTFGRYVKELQRRARHVSLSALPGSDDGDGDERHSVGVMGTVLETTMAMDTAMLYREGLATLEEPYRTAFVLRHYAGWPIEHQDPTVPTISRHFDKTPRTIRNWMNTAEATLAAWRGEG